MATDGDIEAFATLTYFDRVLQMPAVKLLPGEFHVANTEIAQVTVLGSCVAACIHDRRAGVGGMNHFMLPDGGRDGVPGGWASSRYGVYAMEVLINELIKLGASRSHMEAKVFGGANVMNTKSSSHVGQRNADFVLNYLETECIKLVASDLVDNHPRKVCHLPVSGRVRVHKLLVLRNETIFQRERDYSNRLHETDSGGDFELFA